MKHLTLAFSILLFLLSTSSLCFAENYYFTKGMSQYKDLDFENAKSNLERAIQQGDLSTGEIIEAREALASIEVSLENPQAARQNFVEILRLKPYYKLSPNASPLVWSVFLEAKRKAEKMILEEYRQGILFEILLGMNIASPGSTFEWETHYCEAQDSSGWCEMAHIMDKDSFNSEFNPIFGLILGYQWVVVSAGLEFSYLYGTASIDYQQGDKIDGINFSALSMGPFLRYYFRTKKLNPFVFIASDYYFIKLDKNAFLYHYDIETSDNDYSDRVIEVKETLNDELWGVGAGFGLQYCVYKNMSLNSHIRWDYSTSLKKSDVPRKHISENSHFNETSDLKYKIVYMPLSLFISAGFVFGP